MKVVIIGGGSQSTPHLFASSSLTRVSSDLEAVIVGRSISALDAVARASSIVGGIAPRVFGADDVTEALSGADVVILQARYGGYEGRIYDESFPLLFDIPGDEGLGPGGLAAAWRSWPHLEEVCETIAAVSPSALTLLMTAPLGILTRCAIDAFPKLRIYGICELPYVTLLDACGGAGSDLCQWSFSYAGVNHIGWLFDIENGTRTLPPIPLKYVRLDDNRHAAVAEQRAAGSRGERLASVRERAMDAYARGNEEEIRRALALRPAPWYEHAVAPLIAGLIDGDSDTVFFLTTRNEGYLKDAQANDVVEIPHRLQAAALRRFSPVAVPREIRERLLPFIDYERAASVAVRERSEDGIRRALVAHPWVAGDDMAAGLLSYVCS